MARIGVERPTIEQQGLARMGSTLRNFPQHVEGICMVRGLSDNLTEMRRCIFEPALRRSHVAEAIGPSQSRSVVILPPDVLKYLSALLIAALPEEDESLAI